jgi:hypothetical protein
MSQYELTETEMQNLLDAITEALIEGRELEPVLAQYNVSYQEISSLVEIIGDLHTTLATQQPSDRFIRSVKYDLMGRQRGIVARVRFLPGRIQIAAGLALVAGFALLAHRRIAGDGQNRTEFPVLQQR